MPGLYDDIRRGTERDNSLFADIMRTVGSTAMTFGSQALKGLTMGAIDTGDLVSDLLHLASVENNSVRELVVHQSSLGEVFFQLTGKELRDFPVRK